MASFGACNAQIFKGQREEIATWRFLSKVFVESICDNKANVGSDCGQPELSTWTYVKTPGRQNRGLPFRFPLKLTWKRVPSLKYSLPEFMNFKHSASESTPDRGSDFRLSTCGPQADTYGTPPWKTQVFGQKPTFWLKILKHACKTHVPASESEV